MSENTQQTNNILLKVERLKTYFPVKKGLLRKTAGHVKAVDDVSFSVKRGQTLGLVGESGCGKTTAARTIIRLIPATSGSVNYDGLDVLKADKKNLKKLRRNVTIIFQDPYSSLNPRMTIGDIIGEPLKVHKLAGKSEVTNLVGEILEKVGLSSSYINRYPHEFSGGQRQRIGVARALILRPQLVICDEPVSALDVSIQSQILNLLKDLQDEFGLTFMFIAHDLAVVEFFCDDIAVMYLGKIVERTGSDELYRNPLHPYTKTLMSAIPKISTDRRGVKTAAGGEVPSALNPPSGCPFHPRCPLAEEKCRQQMPFLENRGEHYVACWKC
ncbi:MAG: dipeptide ABC transporter ATP-binding protein [Sedimentisphaerales bacterium]|nr:dipeptide ABC transporter ATP-binding protein [Sedimentisphaerales bacterium]